MEYSHLVRARFGQLAYAAAAADVAEVDGRAGSAERGAAVELLAWLGSGARLARVRFRAYGCPALLAAADLAAEQLEGQPVEALARLEARALAAQLALPPEKLGRLLLIEDAARQCRSALLEEY
jgi:hypothetical protein